MNPPVAPRSISFINTSREDFLGDPTITSDKNAAKLRPRDITGSDRKFGFGSRYSAFYSEDGAAVYKEDELIASYNFGKTLVVAKPYRRKGVGYGLVYQWRTRFPNAPPATERTKKSHALQISVWERIERELSNYKLELSDWKVNTSKIIGDIVTEIKDVYGGDLSGDQLLIMAEDNILANGIDVSEIDISPLLSSSKTVKEEIECVVEEMVIKFNVKNQRERDTSPIDFDLKNKPLISLR